MDLILVLFHLTDTMIKLGFTAFPCFSVIMQLSYSFSEKTSCSTKKSLNIIDCKINLIK